MAKNQVIGHKNTIPWHITEDYVRTHRLTKKHPIIMGRKNYEMISSFVNFKGSPGTKSDSGKILPNRTNIILTRQEDYIVPGAIIAHSLEEGIDEAKKAEGSDEIFIFGGESIYREGLEKRLVDKIYLTVIDEEIEGDVFFPEFNKDEWNLEKELKRVVKVNAKEIRYFFKTYTVR